MELLNFAWNFFKQSGDIEGYMLYHEMENQVVVSADDTKEKAT